MQREQEFAVAGAQAEGGEEGSVDDERPGSERQDEGEQPGVAEDVQVEEDDEDGGENHLDDEDEEHVGEGLAEEESGGGRGGHALGFEDLVALLAGPGLVEGGDGGEEEGDPEDASGDLAGHGGVAGGVEGEARRRPPSGATKKSMPLMESRERHSRRRSLRRWSRT